MSLMTVPDGALVRKDPSDSKTYAFDWDAENLSALATIVTSTWTITPVSPSRTDGALVMNADAILTGPQGSIAVNRVVSDARVTQVRLVGGTLGQVYAVANTITTSETPSQTKERSVRVLVEDL